MSPTLLDVGKEFVLKAPLAHDASVTVIVLLAVAVGALFAVYYYYEVAKIKLGGGESAGLLQNEYGGVSDGKEGKITKWQSEQVKKINQDISDGANAFLFAEYSYMGVFIVAFSLILFIALGFLPRHVPLGNGSFEKQDGDWHGALFSVLAFVTGSTTSIVAGFIGMRIAVFANARTTLKALEGFGPSFTTAFKAGVVMGFSLVALGVFNLYILVNLVNLYYSDAMHNSPKGREDTMHMYEAIASYGLGGSSIALFGRVGGGIYTKAADVGADMCKIKQGMKEDSPQNPAVIADNVGDNVGDIAGMGADLFGSFAEASSACMVITAQSPDLYMFWTALSLPMLILAGGIFVCLLTSFFATHIKVVQNQAQIEPSLKLQLVVSTFLMTPVTFALCHFFLPPSFHVNADNQLTSNVKVFFCIMCGLWSGLAIGYITEYYTSYSYGPVQEVSVSCKNGASTNIIYGLALGYKSVIIPTFCLAITIYVSYKFAGMYGIGNAALGILSTMAIGLTIDAYGPICDNAGGIAEMARLPEEVRECTDALDAAGNTTAAIGKGFAIGSAALVSLALFGAFVNTVGMKSVDILQPFEFAGLLVGAMLPYWFSAMTMKSVGMAAQAMCEETERQFNSDPRLVAMCKAEDIEDEDERNKAMAPFYKDPPVPDYQACIAISTEASLREMIAPGALVMLTPLLVGFLFGTAPLAGVLAGSLVSGVQMAISASNTGGAWDNAKKYIEQGQLGAGHLKGSETHKAAVVGDTVGDPLKDTSGPALNILIKLSAIISLVFAPSFPQPNGYLIQIFD